MSEATELEPLDESAAPDPEPAAEETIISSAPDEESPAADSAPAPAADADAADAHEETEAAAETDEKAAETDEKAAMTDENAALLDRWVEAKRAKDWYSADKLRAELRSNGVEPEQERPNPKQGSSSGPRYLPGDPVTEAKLDEWVNAKRSKDFATADRIREDLRAGGVNPDTVRPAVGVQPPPQHWGGPPAGYRQYPPPPTHYDPATEAKLADWVSAKRGKDFGKADKLREELRAAGVDPDTVRPAYPSAHGSRPQPHAAPAYGYAPPAGPPQSRGYDPTTEAKLTQWVNAKRAKDFYTADRLREELRAGGVDPDTVRPALPPGHGSRPPSHAAPAYGYAPPYGNPHAAPQHGPSYGGYDPSYGGYDPSYSNYPPSYGNYAPSYGGGPSYAHHPAPHAAPPSSSQYDPATEAKLTQWVSAKRAKDFYTADRLREELRAGGVDPDTARPFNPGAGPGGYKRQRSEY